MEFTYRQQRILEIVKNHPDISITEIRQYLKEDISQPTLNRDLAKLVASNKIERYGKARAVHIPAKPDTQSGGKRTLFLNKNIN